jgi:hypothetical protein
VTDLLDGEPVAAPFYSLARGAWVPYALRWDAETGEFHGIEGPVGLGQRREIRNAGRHWTRVSSSWASRSGNAPIQPHRGLLCGEQLAQPAGSAP